MTKKGTYLYSNLETQDEYTRFRPNIETDNIFINVRAHTISIILNTFTVLKSDKEG